MPKQIFVAFSVFVLIISAPQMLFAQDLRPDTFGNRLAEAKRYLDIYPMEEMLSGLIEETSKNYPAEAQRTYINLLKKSIRIETLNAAMLSVMAKHFTLYELKVLADFYGSEVGRSIVRKFPFVMAELNPIMEQEMIRAIQEFNKETSR